MSRLRQWGVLIGAGLSSMLVAIDFTVVNTSLVAIQESLSSSLADLQWFISAFGIPFCALLVIFGRLADLFGGRMILYSGMIGFGLSSLAAGFSSSSAELIVWRFFLGLFGASIFPCGMALTAGSFPKKEQGRALGIYSGLLGVGLAVGPVVGGLITTYFGWNWIFFVNIPVLCLSFLICLPSIPLASKKTPQKIDWKGLVLLLIGLTSLVTWITEGPSLGWSSPFAFAFLALAILFLWLFYLSEKKTSAPLLPFHFFQKRSFLIGTLSNFASISLLWGVIFVVPIFLQRALHYSITDTGAMVLIMTVMTVLIPPLSGYLHDKKGRNPILILIFSALVLGYISALIFTRTGEIWQFILALFLLGFGWGGGNGICAPIVLSDHPFAANAGLITGAATTLLNMFGVLIATLTGTFFRWGETVSSMYGFQVAVLFLLGLTVILGISLLFASRKPKKASA